jgi:hypothetical protein
MELALSLKTANKMSAITKNAETKRMILLVLELSIISFLLNFIALNIYPISK